MLYHKVLNQYKEQSSEWLICPLIVHDASTSNYKNNQQRQEYEAPYQLTQYIHDLEVLGKIRMHLLLIF